MSESATHAAIEAIARNSYGRLVAYIASRTGDIADAQDALSEALVSALETWPTNGVPNKPEAWLMRVARNRLIDATRREQTRLDAEPLLQQLAEEAEATTTELESIPDERRGRDSRKSETRKPKSEDRATGLSDFGLKGPVTKSLAR